MLDRVRPSFRTLDLLKLAGEIYNRSIDEHSR